MAREGASTRGKQPRPTDKVPKPTLSERRKGGAVGSGEVGLEAAILERKRNSASAESPRPPSMDRGYEWYRILGCPTSLLPNVRWDAGVCTDAVAEHWVGP